ncbi:lipopolysaccharide biosynthesis protein [Ligilactobacillus salivarius]|uniref:lipopolysaccharide biosynthesis protein n=1 Tax=Ligilactobacillus salivarius TaxID=1624 RepID=UPI003314742F
MKYIRSNFFKSFIILASGSLIAQLVTALVSPAMTRLFTTTSIGKYTYVLSVVNLFYPVIALQYDYMIVTEKDEDKVFALLKLSFILLIISTVLITVGYLMINFHQKKVGLIAVILSIMMLSNGFVDIIGNYNNRYKQYSLISETYITRSLAQNLLMLLAGYFKLGIIGLLLSQAIGSLVGLKKQSSLLIKERKKVVTSSFSKMKEVMIKYRNQALYTTPAVFMGSFSYNALNIFIAQFYGNSILGLYSMSYRILGMPVNLVSNNLAKVFYEEAAREYESKGSFFNSYRKTLLLTIPLAIGMFIVLVFFAPQIFSFVFGKNWKVAGIISQILAPMFSAKIVTNTLNPSVAIVQKQGYNMLFQILSVIMFIFLVVFVITFKSKIYVFLILYSVVNTGLYVYMSIIYYKFSK